ncbi:AdipoR/hemolysin-III-related [Phytophthora cactorum]|nr:AdipoR/hemolysin-III-related [Phytophthora cactorum]
METGHRMLLRSHTKKHQAQPKRLVQPSKEQPAMSSQPSTGKLHTFERLHAEGFAYLADNSYIRSGYRLHYSARDCFLSLFELHNETLNVGRTWSDPLSSSCSWPGDNGQQWIVDGRHTPRMLLATGLPELCPPPTGRVAPAKYYEVASVIFDHSLQRLPSLERFHALVEQNVGGFSDSVGTQMEQLRSELGALSARLGGQMRDAHSEQSGWGGSAHEIRAGGAGGVAESVRKGLHILATAEGPHNVPHWPIFAFMASAVICLTCSATFHLMFVVSRSAYMFLSRLDYAGITILIAGSFYPLIYYSFYCHPWLRSVYLVSISTMAALTFVVALLPIFGTPKFLVARTCIFLALGFFGVVPVTHLVWHFGLFDPHVTVMIGPLLLMGLLYTSGAIIYATKFPERFFPGRFDLWFSSHQLWHICVVAAALVHFANALQQYEWRWNTHSYASFGGYFGSLTYLLFLLSRSKMSGSSPRRQGTGSPVAKLQLELPPALGHEMQSTGRCSFDAQGRFAAFEQALAGEVTASASPRARNIRRFKPSYRSPRDEDRYRPFATTATKGAVAARLGLAIQAAQQNSPTTRTPYRAPSDHEFREPTSPLKWAPQVNGRDFQTNFTLPSNQDIRRRTARDQEGFFGAAPDEGMLSLPLSPPSQQQQVTTKAQTARSPSKSSPGKPEFTSRVTHTSRKSANKALQLEIILDQEGLLPQLQEIRQHRYRDEVRADPSFATIGVHMTLTRIVILCF